MAEVLPIPPIADQHAFNLARWGELCADPVLASLNYRVETDQYGHILMTPPAAFEHGDHQFDIGYRLKAMLPAGKVVTECPISTRAGIKAADVVWISPDRLQKSLRDKVLIVAPEICVEVLSPANTREEIEEKKHLYFEAGAEEVWICDLHGRMLFFARDEPDTPRASRRCPNFPAQLD